MRSASRTCLEPTTHTTRLQIIKAAIALLDVGEQLPAAMG
jgi:hypothetical protein